MEKGKQIKEGSTTKGGRNDGKPKTPRPSGGPPGQNPKPPKESN